MSKWVSHDSVRNSNWRIIENDEGRYDTDQVQRAILLDIREELRALNRLLNCQNTIAIPGLLRDIRRNTTKPKKKRVVKTKSA